MSMSKQNKGSLRMNSNAEGRGGILLDNAPCKLDLFFRQTLIPHENIKNWHTIHSHKLLNN